MIGRRPALVALLGAGTLALAAVGIRAHGAPSGDSAADVLLPNLVQAAPGRLSGRTGGTPGRPRFYLGFESAAANLGAGPLVLSGRRTATEPEMELRQLLRRTDGSTRSIPLRARLRYVRSPDHSHWHVLGFMRYELRDSHGRRLLRDRKTGFCLGDRYEAAAADHVAPRSFPDRCGKGAPARLALREGISVGWGDNYLPHLEGQEFELTSLPAGRYVLVHRVNPRRLLRESAYDDDVASLAFDLSWPDGGDRSPAIDVVSRCPGTAVCP